MPPVPLLDVHEGTLIRQDLPPSEQIVPALSALKARGQFATFGPTFRSFKTALCSLVGHLDHVGLCCLSR